MNLLERVGVSTWMHGFKPIHCGSQSCGRWLTHRQLSMRCVGVSIAGEWYCSYRCFRPAAQRSLKALLASENTFRNEPPRALRGLALVRRSLLSDDQYKNVSRMQRESGEDIGEIVVRLGLLTERQVTDVRAGEWNCPVFPSSGEILPSAYQIPRSLMHGYGMAPLHYATNGNRVFVGFAYELNYEALYAVEQIMGCATQPCFVTTTEFRRMLAASSSRVLTRERRNTSCRTVSEIAEAVCSYGASIDADQISLARCGNLIWIRLRTGLKINDLLFSEYGNSKYAS